MSNETNNTPAQEETIRGVVSQQIGHITNYDQLLEGRPEVAADTHISAIMPNSHEAADVLELTARVWCPGLKDPKTGRFGMVATVRKPSPDEEIAIYGKSRVKETPEGVADYLNIERLPPKARAYRFECIWKLVYCSVAPKFTFDWAAKVMSMAHGGAVVKPLIDRIDELMLVRRPIDELTEANLLAYPTLFGDAVIAARDKKLAEYFGSLENGVAQTIRDNARTMALIQYHVLKEDAELLALVGEIVRQEIARGDYETPPNIAEMLREPMEPTTAAKEAKNAFNRDDVTT